MRSIAPSREAGVEEAAPTDFSITHQTTKVASTGLLIPLREDRYAPGVVVEQKYKDVIDRLYEGAAA